MFVRFSKLKNILLICQGFTYFFHWHSTNIGYIEGYDIFESYNFCRTATRESKLRISKDKYEKNMLP